jgi:1-acyl-sn-glycerol-3-phosphate acyltransferase
VGGAQRGQAMQVGPQGDGSLAGVLRNRFWSFGHVHLIIGEPLDLTTYLNRPINQQVVRAATDHLMHTLQQLSTQEYVDSYAEAS